MAARGTGPTQEEAKAQAIAQKLVDALAEFETFMGDPDMIWEAAAETMPKKILLGTGQLKEVRDFIALLKANPDLPKDED